MHVLDLFSGIGGFGLGLERAGMHVIAFCEQDPFARSVLRRHWPATPCFEDVRSLSSLHLHEAGLPPPRLVCGGFPCQDVSSAGPGAGIEGSRSVLWRELVRIVRECRPDWVLVENVPGLRVRGADRLLGALEEEGYTCWPVVVGAVHAGAQHRRQRVFILAHAQGARLEGGQPGPAATAPSLHVERCGGWAIEPGLGRVVDGLPHRLDRRPRLSALGAAVVPDVAETLGRAILASDTRIRFPPRP